MTGIVTISVEVELGWGVHDVDRSAHLSEDGAAERRYLRRLLDACDEYGVPVSFDVVGHLFLEGCKGSHSGPYPDDWFDADPGTDATEDPLYYAPEMPDAVRSRPTDHELCTHTFSHALCEPMGEAVQSSELEFAAHLHETAGDERPVSLVPPRHSPPSYNVLTEHGVEIVRIPTGGPSSSPVRRLRELLSGPPPICEPELVDGVVETYCTRHPTLTAPSLPSGQESTHAAFRWLPVSVRRRLHERYLRRATRIAIEEDSHLHLWCHLFDLSNEYQFPQVESYLETLGALRDRGDVEIRTMAGLNEDVRERREQAPAEEVARA